MFECPSVMLCDAVLQRECLIHVSVSGWSFGGVIWESFAGHLGGPLGGHLGGHLGANLKDMMMHMFCILTACAVKAWSMSAFLAILQA